MAFMGYETPVEIPSMGVYDTDLMKMYIAGIKDQYEKGQEEMKDFMKLYADFYSPVDGATEAYNNMTIGGARNMINQMLAAGIDPYKSPEARAAISRYIASVPTGTLKALELQRENYNKYQDAVRAAVANGTYNGPMELYYLQKEGLDNFKATSTNPDGSIKVNDWTRLAPSRFVTLESITNPFFKDLEKIDHVGPDPKHPGYSIYKVADNVLADALRGGVDAVRNHPNGDFYLYQAEKKLNNAGITRSTNPEDYDQLVMQQLAQDVKDANAQAWQTKSDWDKYAQELRGYAYDERMEAIKHNNAMEEKGYKYNPKTKTWIAPSDNGDDDLGLDASSQLKFAKDNTTDKVIKNTKPGYVFTLPNGKKAAQIKKVILDGRSVFAVEDENGTLKGKGGKKYRRATAWELLQNAAAAAASKGRSVWSAISVYDTPETAVAHTGDVTADKTPTRVIFTKEMFPFIHSDNEITQRVLGKSPNTKNGYTTTEELQTVLSQLERTNKNVYDKLSFVQEQRTGSVVNPDGTTDQFISFLVHGLGRDKNGEYCANDKALTRIIVQVAKYDENGIPDPNWASRMAGIDTKLSGEIYGSTQKSALHNTGK